MQNKAALLTDDSAAAFDRFCTRRRVTFTALMQALGEQLAAGDEWVPESAVSRAGEIDADRRSRR